MRLVDLKYTRNDSTAAALCLYIRQASSHRQTGGISGFLLVVLILIRSLGFKYPEGNPTVAVATACHTFRFLSGPDTTNTHRRKRAGYA